MPRSCNHEAYSMDWKFAEPYTYKALFAVPYGGPKDQNRLAYSFDYGDVHYVSSIRIMKN